MSSSFKKNSHLNPTSKTKMLVLIIKLSFHSTQIPFFHNPKHANICFRQTEAFENNRKASKVRTPKQEYNKAHFHEFPLHFLTSFVYTKKL